MLISLATTPTLSMTKTCPNGDIPLLSTMLHPHLIDIIRVNETRTIDMTYADYLNWFELVFPDSTIGDAIVRSSTISFICISFITSTSR